MIVRKRQKWEVIVTRQSDFWKNYMMLVALGDVKKILNVAIVEHLTTRKGWEFIHWKNPESTLACGLKLEEKIRKNPGFLHKVESVFSRRRKILEEVSRDVAKKVSVKLSNRSLLAVYDRFCDAYRSLYPPFHLTVYSEEIERKAKRWLLDSLKKIGKSDKLDEYFSFLSSTNVLSPYQEEELNLLRLAIDSKTKKINPKQFKQKLVEHAEQFGGLSVINDVTKPWPVSYFSKRLNRLVKKPLLELKRNYRDLVAQPKGIRSKQGKLLDDLRATDLIKKYFSFIQLITWIRTAGRCAFALSHYYSRPLFEELSKRCHVYGRDIKWLTPSEVKSALLHDKPPAEEQLSAREARCAMFFKDGKYRILEGEQAERFIKQKLGESAASDNGSNLIKGASAFPGQVTGRVKIIMGQKDISKMKRGNILVAAMTTPDIIPAIKKAAAIITDEGGITCHAAIVAREFRIPCVVGTKIATRALHDNDLVRVDAAKGIIKK